MINIKPLVVETLKKVCDSIFFYYPESFKKLPCISYYEASNMPAQKADDREYMTEAVFVIDIWGKTSSEVSELTLRVNEEMTGVRFEREFAKDVYQEGAPAHKTMRYKYLG